MGVLEDVVINAKSAAFSVSKEAGRLVDISKLRFSAAELQKEISKKYETLGRMVYDSRKAGNSESVSFDEHIESIDVLYKNLDDVNEKINALSRKTACPNCGFRNDDNAAFCSRCGAKLAGQQPDADAAPQDGGAGTNFPEDGTSI